MSEPSQLPTERPSLHVRDARERSRFEATLGDDPEIVAVLDYRLMEHSIALLHTQVEPGHGGSAAAPAGDG